MNSFMALVVVIQYHMMWVIESPVHISHCFAFYSLQEIETGVVETAKSFVTFDDWTKCFSNVLQNFNYYLVRLNF